MGHRHSRDDLLDAAVALAVRDGLSSLTFGAVARHLGISDRIVVYYFPTKDDLIGSVLGALGASLQQALGAAFVEPAPDHLAIVRAAWPVLARPEHDPVFALFFEANGLAAAGREPYRRVVTTFVEAWVAWVSGLVEGTPSRRRAEAEAVLALIDGLLLLRQIGGPDAASRAARRLLGPTPPKS